MKLLSLILGLAVLFDGMAGNKAGAQTMSVPWPRDAKATADKYLACARTEPVSKISSTLIYGIAEELVFCDAYLGLPRELVSKFKECLAKGDIQYDEPIDTFLYFVACRYDRRTFSLEINRTAKGVSNGGLYLRMD